MNLNLSWHKAFLIILLLMFENNTWAEIHRDQIHEVYNSLLKTFVNNGFVDYRGLKEKEEKLDLYLNTLSTIEVSDMTKKEQLGLFGEKKYTIYLSLIFKWFKEDFENQAGSVISYIVPYLSEENQQFINQYRDKLSMHYLKYDWSLNGR